MGKLPLLNLFFLLALVTLLALQHSVSVFGPTGRMYETVRYNAFQIPSPAKADQAWMMAQPAHVPELSIAYLTDRWQRTMIMREWMLEYGTAYWARTMLAGDANADLLEARFHVANAEVLRVAVGDTQRAKIELEQAARYLTESRPSIQNNLRPAVEKINKELDGAIADVTSVAAGNPEPFEHIKSELDHLIGTVHFAKA
jgi:hypothetical protein